MFSTMRHALATAALAIAVAAPAKADTQYFPFGGKIVRENGQSRVYDGAGRHVGGIQMHEGHGRWHGPDGQPTSRTYDLNGCPLYVTDADRANGADTRRPAPAPGQPKRAARHCN